MQQDNHCIISFMGINWQIAAIRGHLIYLKGREHNMEACLDTSGVRWDEYLARAVEWITPGTVRRM
jgi:hypothetical protein